MPLFIRILFERTGPLIEYLFDRMEITNPGRPLVRQNVFLTVLPGRAMKPWHPSCGALVFAKSAPVALTGRLSNGALSIASPGFEADENNTKVILFAHRPLAKMTGGRVRACYLHACLKYVTRDYMTNASLRERFAIEVRNSAIASRIIRMPVTAKAIKLHDPEMSRKYAKYVPFWAI